MLWPDTTYTVHPCVCLLWSSLEPNLYQGGVFCILHPHLAMFSSSGADEIEMELDACVKDTPLLPIFPVGSQPEK